MANDLIVNKDSENGILDLKVLPEDDDEGVDENIPDNFFLESDADGVFPVQTVPKKDYDTHESTFCYS